LLQSEQVPDIVGVGQFTTAPPLPPHDTLISAGQVIELLTLTVMLNEQEDLFPHPSTALYTTLVTPTGNVPPGLKLLVIVGVPHKSVAIGAVHDTGVEGLLIEILEGQFIILGATLSLSDML